MIEDLWYKNAIFYSLDCETFYDADGDGIGELDGLTERLDYVASLGATCIWLQPFYPSPDRDGGYDITDYLAVDPVLGAEGPVGKHRLGPWPVHPLAVGEMNGDGGVAEHVVVTERSVEERLA